METGGWVGEFAGTISSGSSSSPVFGAIYQNQTSALRFRKLLGGT